MTFGLRPTAASSFREDFGMATRTPQQAYDEMVAAVQQGFAAVESGKVSKSQHDADLAKITSSSSKVTSQESSAGSGLFFVSDASGVATSSETAAGSGLYTFNA